jgi:serralysin
MNNHAKFAWIVVTASVVLPAAPSMAYVPDERWTVTSSGSTGPSGSPVTLTWSFAPDGTSIPGEGASNLIAYLDGLFSVTATSADLTQRPWFSLFESSFDRWSEVGGITFNYEPNDNGSALQSSAGVRGVRGDVRLGGALIDGQNSTLAYTWLPNSGDMVVDTGETSFYSNSASNYRALRNTIMHEVGHALGFLHIESSSTLLMEPSINLGIDGPQLDDIRGIHSFYGDALEKTNNGLGNGTHQRATPLGSISAGDTLAIGSDAAGDQSVSSLETDFVSIANNSDIDFFSFSVAAPTLLNVTLTPLGGVFNQGTQGNPQSSFDANSRNDLTLAVFATNGLTPLGSANLTGAGGREVLSGIELLTAGTYFVRIQGTSPNVQLYELELSAALLSVVLEGDYNNDGSVDAADYAVWRNNVGQGGTGLAADGNGDGTVNIADYGIWRANFGRTETAPTTFIAAVPEPEPHTLLWIGALIGLIQLAHVGTSSRVTSLQQNRSNSSTGRNRVRKP